LNNKSYYLAYEDCYQRFFGAGAERWRHSPDDEALISTLEKWGILQGKKIIEFACGESYRINAYEGKVESFEDWERITGSNYDAPERRTAKCAREVIKT
jgi:hypothetical protein